MPFAVRSAAPPGPRLRLRFGAVFAAALVVPGVMVVPTLTGPRPEPVPVTPNVQSLPLAGVDRAALRGEVPDEVVARIAAARSLSFDRAAQRAERLGPAVLSDPIDTEPFRMLGVTWRDGDVGEVSVLARTRTDGRWSDWFDLHSLEDVDDGPSPNGRLATAPFYAGSSDGVQIRVDTLRGADPRGVRVDLIEPGTSPADAAVVAAPPPGSAAAAASRPPIVTRAQWGADESLRAKKLDMSKTVKVAFVHHTAGSNNYGPAEGPVLVRGLYSYYVKTLGYSDIGYNMIVDRYGQIYEGRAGSITEPVRQAATGGFNTDTMSVVAMGNFVDAAAPDAMVRSIAKIVAFRLSAYHRDPTGKRTLVAATGSSRYSAGQKATFRVVSGHRDAGYTACPGGRLYDRMGEIRRQVKREMGANLVEPKAAALAGEPTSVEVRSRVLQQQRWTLTVTQPCTSKVVRRLTGTAAPDQPIRVAWRGLDDSGRPVAPGQYRLTLTSENDSSRAVPWRTNANVQVGSAAAATTRSTLQPLPAGRFVPVGPRTLAVTRSGQGIARPLALGAGSRVDVPVLGRAGVPAEGVAAVVLSVQSICPSRDTTLWLRPSRVATGAGAALSVDAGRSARGLAVVAPGPDGAVTIANQSGVVGARLDVVGYLAAGGGDGYVPVSPATVFGGARGAEVPTGGVTIPVAGVGKVPSDATAAVLTVRRLGGDADALRVWPAGGDRPTALVRHPAGAPTIQRVVVALGRNGAVELAGNAPSTVAVDVTGYFSSGAGAALRAVRPAALATETVKADSARAVPALGRAGVPATGVRALALQVTATAGKKATRVAVYPAGATRPSQNDLIVPAKETRSTLVMVRPGSNGAVRVWNQAGRTDVRVEVVGWFGAT